MATEMAEDVRRTIAGNGSIVAVPAVRGHAQHAFGSCSTLLELFYSLILFEMGHQATWTFEAQMYDSGDAGWWHEHSNTV